MSAVIEDLKRAVFRIGGTPPSYGGPSLSEAVDDVQADDALYRLRDEGRCIWEIVLHAAYWRHEVAHAVTGGGIALLARGPENWPALPKLTNESTWKADREVLAVSESALLAALDTLDVDRWTAVPNGGGDWTLGQLATGLIAHDAYHVGQVILLKKAARISSKR